MSGPRPHVVLLLLLVPPLWGILFLVGLGLVLAWLNAGIPR